MILTEKVKKICNEYGIGDFVSVDKIQEGVLNDNYVLHTTNGKFFVKSVREKAKDKLKTIYGVESLMKSRGIPAVTMSKTKSGAIFTEIDKEVFTLYLFVESDKTHNFLSKDFYNLGEMLGRIHLAGSSNIPNSMEIKQFSRPSDDIITERLQSYFNDIKAKPSQDDVDKLFLKYIDLKLATIPKVKKVILSNDTLTHGDYHPGNILVDKDAKIIGICDWEKNEFAPRSYELARSLMYTCYEGKYNSAKSLDYSRNFLEGYKKIIQMTREEFAKGLSMRIYRMALSVWFEQKYYRENDSRANHLIGHEMDLIDFYVNGSFHEDIMNLVSMW